MQVSRDDRSDLILVNGHAYFYSFGYGVHEGTLVCHLAEKAVFREKDGTLIDRRLNEILGPAPPPPPRRTWREFLAIVLDVASYLVEIAFAVVAMIAAVTVLGAWAWALLQPV